jgi:hypothetical protein
MKETIIISGIVVLCMGTLCIGLWVAFRNMDKIVAQFRILATQYNFRLTIPSKWSWFAHNYPFARGIYEGLGVTVDMFSVGSGQFKQTYTRVAIDRKYEGLPNFVLTTPSHTVMDTDKYGGIVELGVNPAFDSSYIFRTDKIEAFYELFDNDLQDRLLQEIFFGTIVANNEQLFFYIKYDMLD